MTGVHRKDISVIRETGENKTVPKSLNARAIAQWTANPTFLQPNGQPAVLNRTGPNSFEDLIISISKDIRPRTLLDDWTRRGIVSVNEDDKVELNIQNYIPVSSEEESLHFYGENLADHIATSTHNISNIDDRLFERAVYSDGLSYKSIIKLQTIVEERAMSMLVDINKIAFKMAQNDKTKKETKYRYKFGTYFFKTEAKKQKKIKRTHRNET